MTTEIQHDPKFEGLLDHLKRSRGFDFSGYKRSSLVRRVRKRMQMVGIEDFVDYMDYLEVHPDEFSELFDTILINVTAFFRDPPSWDYLRQEIIPIIVKQKAKNEPIRVWSAGCASGEEAYTLAICFAEELGADQFKERVKIYATDVDEGALETARHAAYATKDVENLDPELVRKYFDSNGSKHVFRTDLRRSVIFGRHDLVQDPPISRIDLLTCRNTLMYMNAETQSRILARLHFALSDDGFLFLGKAEMLLTHADIFRQTNLKHRVFAKTPKNGNRERLLVMALSGDNDDANQLNRSDRLREAAFEGSQVAQIVVDDNGTLVLANELSRSIFALSPTDIGRPIQDLEVSYRPVELRSLIEKSYSEHASVKLPKVEQRLANGQVRWLDVHVGPLYQNGKDVLGAIVTFTDVTLFNGLQQDLERSNQELETANEELQSAHEELETTNEELQSTNEELETTNEELQSTNEELETMNEELQSTNEELETMNTELRELSHEMNRSHGFLQSILSSMRSAVVVVDSDFRVLVWNRRAEDLWGLRPDEVDGQSILALDIGLPVERLKDPLKAFIKNPSQHEALTLKARNRRGREMNCHIEMTPLATTDKETRGVVLMMEENE